MKQIGALAWVDPKDVLGVVWDGYTGRMPLVLLNGGHELRADYYKITVEEGLEQQQVTIENLLKDLGKLSKRTATFVNSPDVKGLELSI